MKYLIAGLGNIGSDYENTRHNIGFNVLDALAGASNTVFKAERYGDVCQIKHKGRTIILLKPNTYMNLSGKAVRYWLDKENVTIENLLVVTDDLALPFGKIRLKGKGSDGGHNGLKSIQELLNTSQYSRLRFGVGNDYPKGRQIDYVLGKWSDEENKTLPERIELCGDLIKSFAFVGLARTMNTFNNK